MPPRRQARAGRPRCRRAATSPAVAPGRLGGEQLARAPPGRRRGRRRSGGAARGSGAGRQTWRRSAALRAGLVSSVSIAASTSPRSPVTSSTGASPERRGDQPEHLGVVRRGVAGVEDFEARLQVFARPVRAELLPPPDRPAIDVARRLGAGVHVQPHDRHGEVGAQHHLRPLVAGDEGARPDVLAVEVEQHVGRLQRRRLDPHRAGRGRARRGSAPPRRRAGRAPAPIRAPFR